MFASSGSWYKRASESKKPSKCPSCGGVVLKRHKSGQEGVYECLGCGRAVSSNAPSYEGSWAHEEAVRRREGKPIPVSKLPKLLHEEGVAIGAIESSVFLNKTVISNEKTASNEKTTSQPVSYDERESLGLSKRDVDHYNAFQDIARMIREHKALTPEQRMGVWKKAVDEDIAEQGYSMIPRLFGENDYSIALRNGAGGGYEAFYLDFKSYDSGKPDWSKPKLNRAIAKFGNLKEASQWIEEEFVKMEARRV